MKKRLNQEDIVGTCYFCKDDIYYKQGFVYKSKNYYHLNCYHEMIDCPLEVEMEEELFDDRD